MKNNNHVGYVSNYKCGEYEGTYKCVAGLDGNDIYVGNSNTSYSATNSANSAWSTNIKDHFDIIFMTLFKTRSYTMFTHGGVSSSYTTIKKSMFLDSSSHGTSGTAINILIGNVFLEDSVFDHIMFKSFSSSSSYFLCNCFFNSNKFGIPSGGTSRSVSTIEIVQEDAISVQNSELQNS